MKHPLYLAARLIVEDFPKEKTFTAENLRELLSKRSRGTARLISDSHPNIWGRIFVELRNEGLITVNTHWVAERKEAKRHTIRMWVKI